MRAMECWDEQVKKMDVWDMGATKAGSMLFGVLLTQMFPKFFLRLNPWLLVATIGLMSMKPLHSMVKQDEGE